MEYLGTRQTLLIKYLHITIFTLVIVQIIISNFMKVTKAGEISDNIIEFYDTWLHIITGLLIIPLTALFIVVLLKQHGFGYYFSFVTGDCAQLKKDINKIMKFELPKPIAGGLAAAVEGLGLGALALVLFQGWPDVAGDPSGCSFDQIETFNK